MRQRGKAYEKIRHQVAEESMSGMKTGYLARKYEIHPETVRTWVREYKQTIGVDSLPTVSDRVADAKRVEELEESYARALKALGEKELELAILRELVKKPNPASMKK
jgi:transposase-like protein